MNRKTILSLGSALVALSVMSVAGYGCGDDDTASPTKDSGPVNNPEAGPMPEAGGMETSTPTPPPPALGTQIDRMGRPAINTAVTAPFASDAVSGMKKDAYNADSAQAGWPAAYTNQFSPNLAILDSLDTVCGNQFLANPDAGASASGPPSLVYGTVAGILADDRLWLNTAGTSCTTYLAVEAAFAANAGLIPASFKAAAGDCGGRALPYDVIDVTYSAVAIGNVTGVTDNVSADPVKTAATAFPYLAPPTQ